MKYTEIRENIWQIEDDAGVYCTLVQGDTMAVLWDTGYGKKELKQFVESHVKTDYIVMNSHGHPDHVGGDVWFGTIFANPQEWDVIEHFTLESTGNAPAFEMKELSIGEVYDLGNMHARVIAMEGHTKGSVGLLLEEERLLLSGDAINENLWMFNYGALPLSKLKSMLERLQEEPFDTFLCGHYEKELPKSIVDAHLKNLSRLTVDESTKCETLGFVTYTSTYQGEEGKSILTFSKELI